MKRAAIYLLLPILGFCGLWSCSPLAMQTVPGAVGTLAQGGASCLGTVGVGLAVALVLLAGGGAVRLARPPVARGALLYGTPPPVRYLDVPVIEMEVIDGDQ